MDMLLKYFSIGLGLRKTQPTLTEHEIPPLFIQPYVHKGYRQPYKPLQYYLYSLFQFHTETLNIWTHLVAFIVFVYNLHWYGQSMDFIHSPLSWAYLTFSVSALAYSFFSTFAHLCHAQSEKTHYLCFQLDYMGIGLACHGTAMGLYFFGGNESFYQSVLGRIFIPSYTVYASIVCMFLSCGKLKCSKPYNANVKKYIALCSNGFAFLYACVPLYYSFYESLCYKDWSYFWSRVFPHLHYIFYYLLAAFFFAAHVPERFFPGHCDIIGQGHQIFHVCMAYCTCTQFSSLFQIYQTRSLDLIHLSNPGLHNTLLPMIVILIVDIVFMYSLSGYRSKRATEEHIVTMKWVKTKTQ